MATIKEATENAAEFARNALGPARTEGLRLEEIESAMEGSQEVWRITLSMISPDQDVGGLVSAIAVRPRRDYKIFTIVKSTGEVLSMKIRELSNA